MPITTGTAAAQEARASLPHSGMALWIECMRHESRLEAAMREPTKRELFIGDELGYVPLDVEGPLIPSGHGLL